MRLLTLLFLPLLLLGSLLAQTPDTSTLRGVVLDPSDAVIPGASVTVTNAQTGLQRMTQTDDSGRFALQALPVAGRYTLLVHKAGMVDGRVDDISLSAGHTAELKIHVALSSTQTSVTVTGTPGTVRADEPQLGNDLSLQKIQQTPLLNRRLTYLPLLNAANRPAVNQGDAFVNQTLITTNGAGRRQTWFEVDGANDIDAWGRQTLFTNLPVDAVQEMSVLTNTFSAEYGFGAGSAINIVTRGGGDAYHGSVVGVWRPSDTAARLWGFTPTSATSGSQITSESLRQAGASLSGPLVNNRTHFAATGEYSWQDRASPITSPIAPGSFVGHYRGYLALLRLDHQFSERHNGFVRLAADSFHDTNPNGTVGGNTLPSVDRIFKRRTYSIEAGETAVLSASLLNTARAQFQLASPITEFAPVILGTQFVVPISAGGTFTTGTSQSAKLLNRQFELNDTLSALHGRHVLKFGGGFVRAHNGGDSKEFGGPIFLGQLRYRPCTQPLTVCEGAAYLNDIANVVSYTQSFGNGSYTVDDTLWSLFAQDNFHATANLSLNLGVRYDRQTLTGSTHDFAPRLGFAYNWKGASKTVLRGGYGIYYSQVVDDSAANWALTGPTGVFNYTAGPGQIGFPTSVSDVPLPAFPAGAAVPQRTLYLRPGRAAYYDQFLPTSTLVGYQNALLSPYTQQWTFGVEHELAPQWVLSTDYVGSHTVRNVRPLDVNPPEPFVRTLPGQTRSPAAANCTRPYWIWWYQQQGISCTGAAVQPPYGLIQSDVNNGFATYNALDVNLSRRFSERASLLLSYTWSHAIDNVDPDIPQQNPNDPNFTGAAEKASAIFDQRHRFVLSGYYVAPLKIGVGGIVTLGSALPYNVVTGATNSGDLGGTTDRPVVNGTVLGRNAGRGRAIYDVSPFLERPFSFNERVRLNLRVEAFNLFNHPNFVGYSGTWGNGATPGAGFGQPLTGITNQLPARSLQFQGKLTF